MSQDSNNANSQGQGQQQASQWSGKNMSTTIDFRSLEIDIPRAQGPGGRDLGSAKWTLNGRVIWTTELHKTGDK